MRINQLIDQLIDRVVFSLKPRHLVLGLWSITVIGLGLVMRYVPQSHSMGLGFLLGASFFAGVAYSASDEIKWEDS